MAPDREKTMRRHEYSLAALPLAVALAGALLASLAAGDAARNAGVGADARVTPTARAVQGWDARLDPPFVIRLATSVGRNLIATRAQAIDIGRRTARTFEEKNPVLIDAAYVPYRVAYAKFDASGRRGDGAPSVEEGRPPEEMVWIVRMRGTTFRPDRGGTLVDTVPPSPGWMFVVIDPGTGWPLVRGFQRDPFPMPR